MFQTIGRDLDVDRDRRRMTASAITALLLATVVCTAGLYGAMHVAAPLVASVPDPPWVPPEDPVVEVSFLAPGLPPAAAAAVAPPEPVPPKPSVEPVEPTRLDPVVLPVLVPSTPPAGPPSDGPVGPPGPPGTLGGRCPTCTTGTIGASPEPGPKVFHASEVQTRKRVQPVYPEAARALGINEATCRARIFIGVDGTPDKVAFEDCPAVFQSSAEDALMRWRWYPAKVGDVAVPAQFVIVVKYRAS